MKDKKGNRMCDECKRRVEFLIIDPICWLPFFGCKCVLTRNSEGGGK